MAKINKATKQSLLAFMRRLITAELNNQMESFPRKIEVVAHNFLHDYPEYKLDYTKEKIIKILEKIQAIYEL